ncbi:MULTISPECIES: ATP-binding protein [unclassified Cyanobium]|uniref:ATP-binding protein n=1 Tax=unclassified Cyanobium TaxID=2627006 RepID=UPI0020CF4E61|nr:MULTISPECIES: ATP-binding protein [unclassified Cyanobium]MCP9834533.1 ATP-binding protein [Cyanobium sp. La Preciosa 7G6]MCP9937296.1 ATP-binding protein [Cyanobium sp. Aljojuca 7A6]
MTSTASADSGLPGRVLAVNSDLDELQTVLSWFERQRHFGVPTDLWMQAQLGLVEGFTNAVRHAHGHLVAPPPVQLSLHVSSRLFRLQIIDHGEPFDFHAALARVEAEITASGQDPLAREAHWGLVMFLKLQKEYGWTISHGRRDDGTNDLSLSHPLTADESAGGSC